MEIAWIFRGSEPEPNTAGHLVDSDGDPTDPNPNEDGSEETDMNGEESKGEGPHSLNALYTTGFMKTAKEKVAEMMNVVVLGDE